MKAAPLFVLALPFIIALPPGFAAATVDVSPIENLRPALPNIPDRTSNLADYGAVGDGHTLNT
ncbi:MAG: hypothetical protein H7343_24070, partial [Undibacterium sp.]|nr:hypothetical protein [Opitutaceae bacterium]